MNKCMMIAYGSRLLWRGEVWFDNEPGGAARSVDWILYHQRSRPVRGAQTRYFYTFLIDLTQSRAELQARLHRDTAYKIRRARERDRIICESCDPRDPEVVKQYEEMYNSFAAAKGLAALNRARMESMAAAGLLDLSVARDSHGTPLVYHANYRDSKRAAGLELPSRYRSFSDSSTRNLVGRANRYLTWSDILRYQEQGLRAFDFGGWYFGCDPVKLKINDFKRGFGGQVVCEYNCEQVLSLKGWAVLAVASMLERVRGLPGKLRFRRKLPERISGAAGAKSPPESCPATAETPALHEPASGN